MFKRTGGKPVSASSRGVNFLSFPRCRRRAKMTSPCGLRVPFGDTAAPNSRDLLRRAVSGGLRSAGAHGLTRLLSPQVISPVDGVADERFVAWMRTAALPTFRTLYGRIEHDLVAPAEITFNLTASECLGKV